MDKLAEILKQHIWCVITIATVILLAFITLSFGEDVNLVSHLSLTSAIVSIVLTIIVIVYMFFQDQRSSQNAAEMKKLVDEASRTMTDKAGLMADRTQSLKQMIAGITQPPPDGDTTSTPLVLQEGVTLNASACSNGGLLVLYSLAKSYELRKPMSWAVISGLLEEKEEHASIFRYFGFGVLQSLKVFWGQESFVWSKGQQEVKKLPEGFKGFIDEEINNRAKKYKEDDMDWEYSYFENACNIIDNYFKTL